MVAVCPLQSFLRLFLCMAFGGFLVLQAEVQVQQVPLNRGWNLVSIQVGSEAGVPTSTIRAGITDENSNPVDSLVSAWGFDSAPKAWTTFQPANSTYPNDLQLVRPGMRYWVQVNQTAFLRLTNEPWNGNVILRPGWNLVGFPGLRLDLGGLSLESVFRDQFTNIQQVWTFDSVPSGQRYICYDLTARVPIKELSTLERKWKRVFPI